jgi:hypothetical protein
MQAELKKLLSAKPFVPFTIVMSDGTHITDGGETAEHLYLPDVTRIQRQTKEAA